MTNTEIDRALRRARSLSHSDISRRVGISKTQSRNIEAGKNTPSVQTAMQIARLLRTRVETLWPLEAA